MATTPATSSAAITIATSKDSTAATGANPAGASDATAATIAPKQSATARAATMRPTDMAANVATTTRPGGGAARACMEEGSSSGGLDRPRALVARGSGHQVESNVPGRCTGGISRTVGEAKA